MPTLPCPSCTTPMTPVHIGPALVDRCPACAAQWFDRTELEQALTTEAPALPDRSLGRLPQGHRPDTPACPQDRNALQARSLAGAELWQCPACHGILASAASWDRLRTAGHKPNPIGTIARTVDELGGLGDVLLFLADLAS